VAKKKENEAKFTAWTKRGLRMEANGSISACSLELFSLIDSADLRDKILRLMIQRHEELIQHAKHEALEKLG
jgi:hypothetical protein